MIYIYNNNNNRVVTDVFNTQQFAFSNFQIYFGDMFVGQFNNETTNPNYIIFSIPKDVISGLKLTNMEYEMKIYVNNSLHKTETIKITSGYEPQVYGLPKTKTKIDTYEYK